MRIEWHPEGFLNQLKATLADKLEESGDIVKEKSKNNCPVRTGKLQKSIESKTDRTELIATIGSDVEYAPYVELGTRKMAAQPYLRTGLMQSINRIRNIFSRK